MVVAWQGWRMEVPEEWAPARIEGDAQGGYVLLADLHGPRLGIRWKQIAGGKAAEKRLAQEIESALRSEVGLLAAKEAIALAPPVGDWKNCLLYTENQLPGRDVWVGYSANSRRLLELVYHPAQRDRLLAETVLSSLSDQKPDAPMAWSIFDLSCRLPAGWKLQKQRLYAGDMALFFGQGRWQQLTVRQIAVAKMALQRRPLERWVTEQISWHGQYYRPGREDKTTIASDAAWRCFTATRRRRYCWMRWIVPTYPILARHDTQRDRLLIVEAPEQTLAREVLQSMGWASSLRMQQDHQANS